MDLFYKLLLVYMASIATLWESELITLLPAHTSLAQYCPIDPKVEPATWLLLENPITYVHIYIIILHVLAVVMRHDSIFTI